MAQKGGGAASDCARVLVYDTAKRRMQHVFTVLYSVCPMPQPQLFSPNSRSPLYMLELSLKRLAILLDCAVVLKTRRIAPVCIGVASQAPPPPPSFHLPLAFCCPGQAEIYAHMLSTLFALKRGEGSEFAPFWGLALHSFALQDMRRVAPAPVPPSPLLLLPLSPCLPCCTVWLCKFSLALAFFLRVFACFLN